MKHALLFIFLVPQIVFAQHPDPRIRQEAPYPSVKSVKTITYFTLPKDGNKLDTCIVETHLYNQDGLLTQHNFAMVMQKNPRYEYGEIISYSAEDAWTKRMYKQGLLTDSIVVNGAWANEYSFSGSTIRSLHEFRGDSMQEKMINGGDTIFRTKTKYQFFNHDEFWDYRNAGSFARKAVTTDKDGAATVTYYSEKDEALVSYVEHRTAGGPVSQIDYYNYKIKRFDIEYLTYSEWMSMTFFLKKSKKGKWSFQKLFTYDDKGHLTEEKWIEPNPKKNQVVIKYQYEFY